MPYVKTGTYRVDITYPRTNAENDCDRGREGQTYAEALADAATLRRVHEPRGGSVWVVPEMEWSDEAAS